MSGLIKDDDIALVRERSPIADVVGQRVALKPAGSGRLKGLCPFHEEKTPSFNVNSTQGFFYCFGCGEGGDVISFVQKTEHVSFTESVQWLADKAGITLTFDSTDNKKRQDERGSRRRLLQAHTLAAQYYMEQLSTPEAVTARRFLADRGFDQNIAERFECGYSKDSWDALTNYLRQKGFTGPELMNAGISKEARSGSLIDRFRGRLMWPIRDITGDVVGFGARQLSEDGGPKYLNSSESPIYSKSQVLYGLDKAKREISQHHRAVVVEGYTDVMACHVAGVTTAVATCGTAFGEGHVQILRRLMLDQDEFSGEVIFTFDGDAAGQKAALRAFESNQKFLAQTFVAVEKNGLDPCDVRVQRGDQSVRDLVDSREPLVSFVLKTNLAKYNIDQVEGQVQALERCANIIASVHHTGLRDGYTNRLAGWLGMELAPVTEAVRQAVRNGGGIVKSQERSGRDRVATNVAGTPGRSEAYLEREALKLAVQLPILAGPLFDAVDATTYSSPTYAAIRSVIAELGGVASVQNSRQSGPAWVDKIMNSDLPPDAKHVVPQLAVEPFMSADEPDARYVSAVLTKLQENGVNKQISVLRSQLQRINPLTDQTKYHTLFGEMVALEQVKRSLNEQAVG